MPDTNAMTYGEIVSAIKEKRFPSSPDVRQWVKSAYSTLWYTPGVDWSFAHVRRQSFTVDSSTPTMPAGFDGSLRLYDEYGDRVRELDETAFDHRYANPNLAAGRPEAYTIVDRQVIVGPAPLATYTWAASYKRRPAHRNAGDVVVEGFFTSDDDYPIWDDFHDILVPLASWIGLGRRDNDTSAANMHAQYTATLAMMVAAYDSGTPQDAIWGEGSELVWQ